jgi:hypothetical protein
METREKSPMSSSDGQDPSGTEDLQFDHAEYTSPPPSAVTCKVCARPIPETYFELNQQILCEPCAGGIDARFRGGSKLKQFLKAGLFGLVAAIGGTIVLYLFREITHLQAAIISILAGYMVGSAIRKGSGYRGGRVYQVMAIFLTYSALSWSYLPDVYKSFKQKAEAAARKGDDGGANASGAASKKEASETKKAGPVVTDAAPEVKAEREMAHAAARVRNDAPAFVSALGVALLLAVMLALAYVLPIVGNVLNMPQGIIGLLILFWGLQQAWRLTRKVTLNFRGPFRVGATGTAGAEIPSHG